MRTILVVDDERASREGLLILLARAGYRTIGAATLKEADALIQQEHPDFLVVDVRLSGDNGLQLIAMSPQPIPAVVITGFDDHIIAADARHLGADYMVKPIVPSALLELIERKLGPADSTAQPSRRWPRRPVSREVTALVGDAPARIVDVAYGGVRFEVPSGADAALSEWVKLTFPGSVSVAVRIVWNRRRGDTWQCGATVNDESRPAWERIVDTLSSSS